MNEARPMILMNPGPVTLSPRVRQSMGDAPDMCHREPEFNQLLQDVRHRLLKVYDLDPARYTSVILAGSGTSAVETSVCASVDKDERLLVICNGVYGERMADMADVYRIPSTRMLLEWGQELTAAALEKALDDGDFAAIALVHHETTTGILNDISMVTDIARARGVRVILDAVSSFAGEEIDFDGIDILAATANKCIHGIPGTAFVIFDKIALERRPEYMRRSVYLDLATHLRAQDKGSPAFTPAVPSIYVLREALDELLEEGVDERMTLYRKRAQTIRSIARDNGLGLFCEPARMSSTLTSIQLPDGVTYDELHDRLKNRGFVIYAGQGGLRHNLFRVSNMGEMSEEALQLFGAALSDAIKG